MPIVKVNGVNLNYQVEGQGEPLVMIMGLSGTLKAWKYQTREFQKSFQVITFDNRGVGRSDRPKGPYSTKMMAGDVCVLMDYLRIKKANILGVSLGGAIAQEFAISYPDRVTRLILASTYACIDEQNGGTPEMMETANWHVRRGLIRLVSLTFNSFLGKAIFLPQAMIQAVFMTESDAAGFSGQRDAALKHNALDRLASIKVPTLVITGTEDRVVKERSSDTLANAIPAAKLVKLNGGSHAACGEMSKAFNQEILSFLKGE